MHLHPQSHFIGSHFFATNCMAASRGTPRSNTPKEVLLIAELAEIMKVAIQKSMQHDQSMWMKSFMTRYRIQQISSGKGLHNYIMENHHFEWINQL